jgi:hypothetical protein
MLRHRLWLVIACAALTACEAPTAPSEAERRSFPPSFHHEPLVCPPGNNHPYICFHTSDLLTITLATIGNTNKCLQALVDLRGLNPEYDTLLTAHDTLYEALFFGNVGNCPGGSGVGRSLRLYVKGNEFSALWIAIRFIDLDAQVSGYCIVAVTGPDSWIAGVQSSEWGPSECAQDGGWRFDISRVRDWPGIVDCGQAMRGVVVNCRARGQEGLAVQRWKFTDAAGDSVTLLGGDLTWTGIAVTSGTVNAEVTVNGAPRPSISTIMTVQDRDWKWTSTDWLYQRGGGIACNSMRWVVDALMIWGWNFRREVCRDGFIHPDPAVLPLAGYQVAQVPSGPNAGRWWVASAAYTMDQVGRVA